MNEDTFEKTVVAHEETLVERDALEELLKHPLLADLPRVEGYPVLGSYVMFAQLGSGGMANVFRGVHARLESEVAIKIRTAPVGTAAARFQREAMVAAKLEHQNLVRATDVDQVAGLQYMVLDYIDGEDADERVARKGALEAREALTIIRDSALGLAEAHRLDFLHRDIKPANVMISREGRVKLADLGLAKSVFGDDLGLTATGGILGTPMYMAPEQFRRADEVVKASDVYGLGVTLIFLLTGRHPFDGKSVPELMGKVCVEGVARLDETMPALDQRVVELVSEAASLEAGDRPSDGAALAVRVGGVLDALGGPVDLADPHAGASKARGVKPPDPGVRTRIKAALTGPDSGLKTPSLADAEREPRSKLRWVAAAMLLAAAGGIGWSVWQRQAGGVDSNESSNKSALLGSGAENEPTPDVPSDLTMGAIDQAPAPVILDISPVQRAAAERIADLQWNQGYIELLDAAQSESDLGWLSAVVPVAENFTSKFKEERSYQRTSAVLDEEGREALSGLAELMGTQAPVTSLMAAELGVEYNGLLYEVNADRLERTRTFLRKAEQGDDAEVTARAQFLRGVILVNEYMADPENGPGQQAQDMLTKAARADPDGEAAAWLGILYLRCVDRADSQDDIPYWFETESMLTYLEAAAGETETGDADSVLGHLCSGGLAGTPMSLENAERHYFEGARRGQIGCVGDAVLSGADLERKLNRKVENKILYFVEHGSPSAQIYAREAYALGSLSDSFTDESRDAERFARAVEFLQENASLQLADELSTERHFDRVTICLGAMRRASRLFGVPTDEENRLWLEEHVDALAAEIYSDGPLVPALPIWLLLADFDPALAKKVLVKAVGPGAKSQDEDELVQVFVQGIDAAEYQDAPFVWSFIEPALEALGSR